MALVYHFDWDANKARTNQQKHGISFRLASTVFKDALALTIYDDGHSEHEERWVTIGRAENGQTLVVVHTFATLSPAEVKLRIISARRADRHETKDYEESPR